MFFDIIVIMVKNSPLSHSHPALAKQWHPTKNERIQLDSVGSGSKKVVWWLGECEHEWEAAINSRVAGRGCHFCSGFKVLSGFNDLVTIHPTTAIEWHPTKNGTLTPQDVSPRSKTIVWWLGKCGHEWQQRINNRVISKVPCLVCSGDRILVGYNDLSTTHPEIAAEWHPNKNDYLSPFDVTSGANKKVWWLGGYCGHEWEMLISSRKEGQKCPICAGKKVLVGFNDLSSVAPHLVLEWNTKKNLITAQEITSQSGKSVWWQCLEGHEWEAAIYSRVNGNGCPVCAGKVLSYNGKRGEKSFVEIKPELTKEWHPTKNLPLLPENISYGSKRKIWWLGDCGHEWEAAVATRVKGQSCIYCSNYMVLPGFNDLATTHPELAKEWNFVKNEENPNQIISGSGKKVWWVCDKGHEWETIVGNRGRDGNGCPECAAKSYISKGEKEVFLYIKSLLKDELINTNVRNIINGELDIYLPDKKIAIEYNGLYWHSEKFKLSTYHKDKWTACKDKGIQLIQVWEDDWNEKKEIVKKMLSHKLKIANVEKVFARQTQAVSISAKDAKTFLEENHLQGYRVASYYGLKSGNKIVSILGVTVKNKHDLEIIRFATSGQVVGGFSKLLSHVLKQDRYVSTKKVFSYSHNDHSTGELYESNGFVLLHEGKPGYSYWSAGWKQRQFRLKYSPSQIKKNPSMKYIEGMNEIDLATLNKLVRVWDSGSTLWVKEL